jgi:hypothetical protein
MIGSPPGTGASHFGQIWNSTAMPFESSSRSFQRSVSVCALTSGALDESALLSGVGGATAQAALLACWENLSVPATVTNRIQAIEGRDPACGKQVFPARAAFQWEGPISRLGGGPSKAQTQRI